MKKTMMELGTFGRVLAAAMLLGACTSQGSQDTVSASAEVRASGIDAYRLMGPEAQLLSSKGETIGSIRISHPAAGVALVKIDGKAGWAEIELTAAPERGHFEIATGTGNLPANLLSDPALAGFYAAETIIVQPLSLERSNNDALQASAYTSCTDNPVGPCGGTGCYQNVYGCTDGWDGHYWSQRSCSCPALPGGGCNNEDWIMKFKDCDQIGCSQWSWLNGCWS